MTRTSFVAALTAFGIVCAGAPVLPALADQVEDGVEIAQAAGFEEAELQSFAKAAVQIEAIRVEAQSEMQAASDEETMQQINDEAVERMVAVIDQTPGIDIELYDEIASLAAVDEELAREINRLIDAEVE